MPTRSRTRVLLAALAVIVAGLASRNLPGLLGDATAGILYAALLYLVIAFLAPASRAIAAMAVAAALGIVIELFQLTGIPADLMRLWPPLRYVFGSTFVLSDLAWAVIGAALGALSDRLTRHRRSTPPSDAPADPADGASVEGARADSGRR